MSQIQIRCACGHTITAFIDYTTSVAAGNTTALYQGDYVCPECADATSSPPSLHIRDDEHHVMHGSAFQVAWALGIRLEHLRQFEHMTEHLPEGTAATMRAEMKRLANAQTDARWWIDHEDNTFHPFITQCTSAIRSLVIHAAYSGPNSQSVKRRHTGSL